jgi:hypothetical protein
VKRKFMCNKEQFEGFRMLCHQKQCSRRERKKKLGKIKINPPHSIDKLAPRFLVEEKTNCTI